MSIKLKMGVAKKSTKTKDKAKSKLKSKTGIKAAEKLVKEMVAYRTQIAVLSSVVKGLNKPLTALTAEFIELVEQDIGDEESTSVSNGKETIEVSAKTKVRTLHDDVDDLIDLLEEKQKGLAAELLIFPLGQLSKYLSEEEIEPFVDKSFGNRSLKY